MASDSTIVGHDANIILTDGATSPSDLDVIGFDAPEGMTVTGRINLSRPRIAIIGGDSTGVRAAMRALLDERYKDMIMADYSEIENRIVAHYPKDDLIMEKPRMEDMEKVYRYQQEAMKEVNPRYYLGEDGQRHGLGRKNGHRGSRAAKDHRSATKRQRSARKKNRKK